MAHVLLVEPDRLLADTYRAALQTRGHSVVMCASAQSAIFATDAQLPDVIVLELQLIEHSGVEFLYELRSYPEWQTIPVIVQTNVPAAEFNASQKLLTGQLGVVNYLYKPAASLQTLLSTVDSRLRRLSVGV